MADAMCGTWNGYVDPQKVWPGISPYIGTGYITSGAIVMAVQEMVQAYGCSVGSSGTDGYYGPDTENAIKCYQQKMGLMADGIVGPNTWAKLSLVAQETTTGGAETNYNWSYGGTNIGFIDYYYATNADFSCGSSGEYAFSASNGNLYWMDASFVILS